MASTTRTVRPYIRVSKDSSGRQRSPEEQLADLTGDAQRQNWRLVEPAFRDVGSASRYQRMARKGFDQLVTCLQEGRFGADILAVWEPRRGSRKVSEWLTLIEACEEHSVLIWAHTHERLYDPRNHRDRRTLLEDAVDGEYDAAQRSEAITRAIEANAEAGAAHGIPPYGYTREYEFRGRVRIVHQVPDPDEAPIVREIFDRFHRGHSLRAIATDLNARGVPTRLGRRWHQATASAILRNPSYGGYRAHYDTRHEAAWEPLVDRTVFLAVQAVLANPTRLTKRPGRARHMLSGLIVCGPCGDPIAVRYLKQLSGVVIKYACTNGHVKATRDEVDEVVETIVLAYLSDPENYSALIESGDSAELAVVKEQLAQARTEHMALADSGISVKLAALKEPPILKRIAELERRERELQTPTELAGLLGPGDDVRERWVQAPMSTKRQVLQLLLVPEVLGQVRLLRSPTGRHIGPMIDRLEFRK